MEKDISSILVEVLASQDNADIFLKHRMKKYTDRFNPRSSSPPAELSSSAALDAAARFERYLIEKGMDAPEAKHIGALLNDFVHEKLPEIGVLATVQELRDLKLRKTSYYPPYPGRKRGGNPIEFLITHYGDDIRLGKVTTGQLISIDRSLYDAARSDLSITGRKIGSLFDEMRMVDRGSTKAMRKLLCAATLLNGTPEETASFFDSLRPATLAKSGVGR